MQAVCYALEEYSRIGRSPDFLTCTDKLQEWNKPRQKRLDALPVTSLTSRRNEILQAAQQEWYTVRSKRITGSKCGKILCQKKRSISLLRECLYPKPLVPLPKPIAWGRHYESVAISKYISQTKQLYEHVIVEKCGFIIHHDRGWLGASPDGRVKNGACNQRDGILEVKCPYSKCEVSPEEACFFAGNLFFHEELEFIRCI